jgi:hypothetical protein
MNLRFSGPLTGVLFALQAPSAQTPPPKVIPNEPACPKCTIGVQRLATLGTEDGIGSLT